MASATDEASHRETGSQLPSPDGAEGAGCSVPVSNTSLYIHTFYNVHSLTLSHTLHILFQYTGALFLNSFMHALAPLDYVRYGLGLSNYCSLKNPLAMKLKSIDNSH